MFLVGVAVTFGALAIGLLVAIVAYIRWALRLDPIGRRPR